MFNWLKKLLNIIEPIPDIVDYTFSNARTVVARSELNNEFLDYHSYLIDAEERPDWCQIVMSKDGHTVTCSFDKGELYSKDTIGELWNEVLRPRMLACKNCIDKQMKESQKYTLELTRKELGAIYDWMSCADDCGVNTYTTDDKDIKALVNRIIEAYNEDIDN